MTKVEVLVNNKPIQESLVKSVEVRSDIDTATLTATLEILQNNYKGIDYQSDIIYSGYEDIITSYDFVTILFNDVVIFTGYMSRLNTSFNKNSYNVAQVELKSKAQDFYESSIRGKRSFQKDVTLYNLIKQMLTLNNFKIIENNFALSQDDEIGVLFKVDAPNIQETARLNNTTQQFFEERLVQDTGIVKVRVPNTQEYILNDNNFSFLSRIANQYNINLTSDEFGNIVLYKPNLSIKTPIKFNTLTIENMQIIVDENDLFYEYQVRMKTQFKNKKDNVRLKQTLSSFDTRVRKTRFNIINSRDTLNGEGLQRKIDGFAGTQRARSKECVFECCFLSKDFNDKTFFQAGDLIEVNLKENGAFKNQTNGVFLIKSIKYNYEKGVFAKKTLNIIEKNYFNAESLKINN